MTILNISLCLPELDIIALRDQHSIVVVTKRFIVPDKLFALMPYRESVTVNDTTKGIASIYQPSWREKLTAAVDASEPLAITHWARCVFCQQLSDEGAIATLADRVIWTAESLQAGLRDRRNLFLVFLQTYRLPNPLTIDTPATLSQCYKFLPLPELITVEETLPIWEPADFTEQQQAFSSPAPIEKESDEPSNQNTSRAALSQDKEPAEDILQSAEWFSKIAEIGRSSDGHTFEKLVRKGLSVLGFSCSNEQPMAGLDPDATGGAGGLDLYADQPYKIVGECKATGTGKVGSNAASQLVRLGLQNLSEEDYFDCIKFVIAGGSLTKNVRELSARLRVNVIRPETMQRLVESKLDWHDDFDLMELKGYLETTPFGECADQKLNTYLDQCHEDWQNRKEHDKTVAQVISTLHELSEQPISCDSQAFSVVEIRAHHNAKYTPVITTAKAKAILDNQLLYSQNARLAKRRYTDNSIGFYIRNR